MTARLAQGGQAAGRAARVAGRRGIGSRGGRGLADQPWPALAGTVPDVPLALPVAVLVGWSLIGSGLWPWRSRRADHLALALIFTGFAWFASMLPMSHNPVLFTAGEVVYSFYYAGFLYLILSFPAGRLQGKLDRALMVIAIALVTVGQSAGLFFADSRDCVCRNCPANLLEVARRTRRSRGDLFSCGSSAALVGRADRDRPAGWALAPGEPPAAARGDAGGGGRGGGVRGPRRGVCGRRAGRSDR